MHNPISLQLNLFKCEIPEELKHFLDMGSQCPPHYENMTEAMFLIPAPDSPDWIGLEFVTRIPPRLFIWHLVNPRPGVMESLLEHVRSANDADGDPARAYFEECQPR